ncbi:hypothetical protein CCAND93_1700003 [Capnocytophaga canis]|uniref:Uncharacterized protein n=1 Tax=Capnocytophaga canis TaxID=1848903 RepID=A0A0B7INP0_9FLAO|nr:hypothetical protein CCAND93_1700003 [Capnocytophaga canis]
MISCFFAKVSSFEWFWNQEIKIKRFTFAETSKKINILILLLLCFSRK